MELLHRLAFDEVQERPVSKHSTWGSTTWTFDDPTAGADRKSVDWGRTLANGSSLLDEEWATFLDASKRLFWSLITEPAVGRPMKPGSIERWTTGFWFIADWMSLEDYRDMTELDPEAVDEYVEYLKAEKATGDDDDDILSGQTIVKYLMPLSHMWQQSDILREAGVETLPDAPFRGKAATALAEEIAEFTDGEIPTVDDDVFIATANELSKWIAFKGDDIVRLMHLVLRLRERHGYNTWMKRLDSQGQYFLRPELADFEFSVDPETGRPWHPSLTEFDSAPDRIRKLVAALNMAGIIMVQAMVGMRISEVCGLDADPDHDGPFPSCVEVESSSSGLFDVFYIKGRLFKTTSEWIEARWVAGLRTKGSDHVPPPVQAVVLVERLFRRWRKEGGVTSLFLTMRSGSGLPSSAEFLSRQRGAPLDQNGWIIQHVGVAPAVRVTSHQWRKSFAKYLFRTDKRLLPAISLHFKHISLAMTEKYIGDDLELFEDIDSEASRNAAERLYEWANGERPARGLIATVIMERCAALGQRLGNHSADEKKREIERIVEENGIRIWTLSHADKPYGACIFRPGVAICRTTRIGPLARPDMASANPGLCSGCQSLAADDEHLGFWQERFRRNQALFEEHHDGDIGVAMLAKKRMDQSRIVLDWFGAAPEEVGHVR
ncbi:MAG TPA: hypothetical protein VGE72_17905 [Azospirillum sp.]